jgi:DDE superfamily endonuclease
MVWGCFAGGQTGRLYKIDEIMDSNLYKYVLRYQTIPSAAALFPQGGFVYMEDNDPKHTSYLCRGYLQRQSEVSNFEIIEWPAQSPDLNPIELLWEEMKRRVQKLQPKSATSLWEVCQEVWNGLEAGTLHKLLERMPFICKMVMHHKGGYFIEKGLRKRNKDLGL